MMFSYVAPTIMSRSADSTCSNVGLTMNSPLTLATLTSDIGPWKGMSDTASAADAASPASASGIMSFSAEIRLIVTNTSAWKSSGKRGRSALSTSREIRISLSPGLASLLRKPPGKRPDAAYFSLYSTDSGMKSVSSFASLAATTVARSIVLPILTTTAPSACLASLPVSITIDRPLPRSILFSINLYI